MVSRKNNTTHLALSSKKKTLFKYLVIWQKFWKLAKFSEINPPLNLYFQLLTRNFEQCVKALDVRKIVVKKEEYHTPCLKNFAGTRRTSHQYSLGSNSMPRGWANLHFKFEELWSTQLLNVYTYTHYIYKTLELSIVSEKRGSKYLQSCITEKGWVWESATLVCI